MVEIYLGSKLGWNVDQGKINEVSTIQINKLTNKNQDLIKEWEQSLKEPWLSLRLLYPIKKNFFNVLIYNVVLTSVQQSDSHTYNMYI